MAPPARNPDLHGNVPDTARAALILIDVVNDLEFDGGAELLMHALPVAERLAALKARAKAHAIPVLSVNDNFGRWRSDFRRLVAHCLGPCRGRPIVERLRPDEDDYFVLKPKHSGFFGTTLDLLLDYLGAQTVILTGFTTDNCVLFTASDAYLRDLNVIVPRDCVAAVDPDWSRLALRHMARVLKADVRPSPELDLAALAERARVA